MVSGDFIKSKECSSVKHLSETLLEMIILLMLWVDLGVHFMMLKNCDKKDIFAIFI